MANNEEQNIVEKAKETKKAAEETAKLAANVSSGNLIGAAKNAFNLLKNKQFRKALKRQLIMIALQCMIPIIIAVCFFSLLISVKDKLIDFLSGAGNSIATFFSKTWKWINDDYWIDLSKELDYTTIDGETKKATIVDQYIYELSELGISLKDLRLLGEADYSNVEELLEDKDNKELAEKYIAEFIRADIITQQPHKRRGAELVNPLNQNEVDGGVYFYRTKKEPIVDENAFENGDYNKENVPVTDKDFVQMDYIDYEKFKEKLSANDSNLRYKFTIDPDTGDLLMVKITTVVETTGTYEEGEALLYKLHNWIQENASRTTEYTLEEVRIPYKEYISKYTMPYEFLINLCTITQNPEFVYHVALLARDTKIILVAQDNTTIKREIETIETNWKDYTNDSSNSTSGASSTDGKTERTRKVITTTTQTPVLKIEYADTWSFYEEFEYTKNITGKLTQVGPKSKDLEIPGTLSNYFEEEVTVEDETGNKKHTEVRKYWYDSFPVKETTTTQVITSTTTYNESIQEGDSVEKSKQFLGLLRNSTGKCEYDCFPKGILGNIIDDTIGNLTPIAYYCSKEAEFDRNGINVQYRIPNMTRTESPLDKLISGLDMLYAALQSNSSGYKEESRLISNEQISESYEIQEQYIADEDYESAYVVKMQGLVEHLRHLMTFPEEEPYTIKDIFLENLFGDSEGGYHSGFGCGFWWPTNAENSPITSQFGMRLHPVTGEYTNHNGIDIAIPTGTEVIATSDGTVSFVGTDPNSTAGLWIKIDHGNGISSVYMHLSEIKVSLGQVVSQGEVIALSGNTGRSTGPHLHFGISVNGTYVDPLLYVSEVNRKPEKIEVGENVEDWRIYIETAFSELGYTMTEDKVTRILRQISTESSGNQNILQGITDVNSGNPITFNNGVCPWCPSASGSSCNNTNIGHGLLQFIPTTFQNCKIQGYENIFNGYHQICALIVNAEEKGGGRYTHIGNGTGWGPY